MWQFPHGDLVVIDMAKVGFYIIYAFLWTIAWLPLSVLYLLSDFAYLIIYRVVRYRVKVTRANLSRSFPQKTTKELRLLERRFYRHLCDYGVETIWLLHASAKAISKHIIFDNIELFDEAYKQKKDVIAVFGHYGNWEWVSSLPIHTNPAVTIETLYRPLKNKDFDKFFLNLRSRWGCVCVDKNRVVRHILQNKKSKIPFVLAFIADQTPSVNNLHYWTNFLNQDTPFLTGWEAIARKTDDYVVFLNVHRKKRGYYHCYIELISASPAQTAEFELAEKYARLMERNILENPAYWLWSHRRWKHQRKE